MVDDSEVKFDHSRVATAEVASARAFRYDVFLCHNMADKPFVKLLADALQIEAGILFFLDEFSIPASVEFMEFIHGEMRRSAACAIFLGRNGWGHTHIQEARLALEVRAERPDFRIIPVNLPDEDRPDWAELFGVGRQPPFNWISMSGAGDDGASAKLIEAVQGHFTVKAYGPEAVTPYYIRRQAALWEKSGRADNSLLMRGKLLKESLLQAGANPAFVSVNSVPAYLARCAQSERNRLRTWLGLSVAAFAIAVSLALAAVHQRNEALRQKEVAFQNARISQVRSLASTAVRSIGEDRYDERALLLARQAYLLDERSGKQSSYLVGASLAEVLATPYLSSTIRLPDDALPERISGFGAYIISGEHKRTLTGPVVGPGGVPAKSVSVDVDEPVVTFMSRNDELLIATKTGDIEVRQVGAPDRRQRLVAALGTAPDILLCSRDGSRAIAVTASSTLTSIDFASGAAAKPWKLRERIASIAVSADGKFVATLDESAILRVYHSGAKNPIAAYPGQDHVNSFDFVGTGNLLVVGERGGALWIWRPSAGGGKRRRLDSGDPRGSIDVIAVSADGQMVATASGAITPGISLWKPLSPVPSVGAIPGQRTLAKLAFSVDKRFLISSSNSGELRYWRLSGTGTSVAVLARDWQPFPLPGRLYTVKRKPGSDEFIVGGDHGVLQIWPSASLEGKPEILDKKRAAALAQVPGQSRLTNGGRNFLTTGHVMAAAVSRNGLRFATVDPYGFALVWPTGDKDSIPALVPSPSVSNAAFSVALSPSGSTLAVGATSAVTYVHKLDENGAAIKSAQIASPGDKTVRALLFLDESHLVVGDDNGRISIWTLAEPPSSRTIVEAGPAVTALTAMIDGRIAVGRGDQVDVIDPVSSGAVPISVSKGLGSVYSLGLSDDGKLLAAGFEDGAVRIWSLSEPGRLPISLAVHKDAARALAFDSSGETIVSVGDDGMIRSSVVGPKRLADLACLVLWRELDADETREFFGPAMPPILPTCARSEKL